MEYWLENTNWGSITICQKAIFKIDAPCSVSTNIDWLWHVISSTLVFTIEPWDLTTGEIMCVRDISNESCHLMQAYKSWWWPIQNVSIFTLPYAEYWIQCQYLLLDCLLASYSIIFVSNAKILGHKSNLWLASIRKNIWAWYKTSVNRLVSKLPIVTMTNRCSGRNLQGNCWYYFKNLSILCP